jgi:hypothetical protein
MFVSDVQTKYDRSGEQSTSPGDFLVLMQSESMGTGKIKGVVVRARLKQFGHWMMGHAKLYGYKFTLSGSYGADGLTCTMPDDIYNSCGVELPQELYDAWNKGGGWNSSGSEGPSIRQWAKDNLAALKKRPKLVTPEPKWVVLNLEGMDDSELQEFYSDAWSRRISLGRELFPGKEDSESALAGLRQCAHWILEARRERRKGNIDQALYLEKELLESDYQALPEYARW